MRLVVNLLTIVVVLALLGMEAFLWMSNPLHIPMGFLPARAFGVQVFHENGSAMEPTLPSGRDVWVTAWPYWHESPQVGDIVAFAYPENPGTADVKRIVAVGGTTIVINGGIVYIDGHKLDEPYRHTLDGRSRLTLSAVKVPDDSYYVLGDNRDESEDSRNYGPIAGSGIIGKQLF